MRHRGYLIALIVLLAGCSDEAHAPPSNPGARALSLSPKDERIASLYEQACRTCHSIAAAGAPLTGDRGAWDVRWQKGMPALLGSVTNGLNGMPPGGQCFSCSTADYEALITFLAGRETP